MERREVLLDAEETHKAILERNKQHFHQAAETPFGHGILADLVGYSGLSANWSIYFRSNLNKDR